MIIRRIGIRSLANIVAAVYVVFGFFAGAILTLVALSGSDPSGSSDAMAKAFLSPLAILVMPLLYVVLGYLGGAVVGWVFNQAAAAWGGLEIEVEGLGDAPA